MGISRSSSGWGCRGTWTLRIADRVNLGLSTLNQWGLRIQASKAAGSERHGGQANRDALVLVLAIALGASRLRLGEKKKGGNTFSAHGDA